MLTGLRRGDFLKPLGLFAIITFLFVSFFGMNLTMTMGGDGKMTNCPLMNEHTSICQMTVGEHLAKWQQMFEALPQLSMFLLFIVFFVFAAFSIFLKGNCIHGPPLAFAYKAYRRQHPDTNLFNYLLQAFSNGILHPKLYN